MHKNSEIILIPSHLKRYARVHVPTGHSVHVYGVRCTVYGVPDYLQLHYIRIVYADELCNGAHPRAGAKG